MTTGQLILTLRKFYEMLILSYLVTEPFFKLTLYRCRPDSYSYWIGLLMIGGLLLIITGVLLIAIFIRFKTETISSSTLTAHQWYLNYFGLLLVASCFFMAWAFGLPAMRPLNLGYGRLVLQILFILFCILCGVLMVVFFCFLSPQARASLCCSSNKEKKDDTAAVNKKYSNDIENNIYQMETVHTKDKDGSMYVNNDAVNYVFSEDLDEKVQPSQTLQPSVEMTFFDPVKGNVTALDDKEGL